MTTKPEVLAMAREAGIDEYDNGLITTDQFAERFAALAFEAGRKAAEQDRVDAERYRWIRENGDKGIFVFDPDKKPRIELAQRDELDTLIDREMSAK